MKKSSLLLAGFTVVSVLAGALIARADGRIEGNLRNTYYSTSPDAVEAAKDAWKTQCESADRCSDCSGPASLAESPRKIIDKYRDGEPEWVYTVQGFVKGCEKDDGISVASTGEGSSSGDGGPRGTFPHGVDPGP